MNGPEVLQHFLERLAALPAPRILEIGTRRWQEGKPGGHRHRLLEANPAAQHVGADLLAGEDVDVVADAHELARHFPAGHFDAFFFPWALEHCRRPWVVAAQLAAVVRPGGVGYVGTHQSFPLHFYPGDFFRFSEAALGELFAPDAGWQLVESGYQYPCVVVPLSNEVAPWNFEAQAYLNVHALVERLA